MVEEETNQPLLGEESFQNVDLTGVIKKVLAACASISGRASHSLGVVCVSKLTPIKRPGRSTDYRDSVAQDSFTRTHFDETRFTSSFANHIQQ